jgi:hypothetical protein
MRKRFGTVSILHRRFLGNFYCSIHQRIEIGVNGGRPAERNIGQTLLANMKIPPHVDDGAADMGFPIAKISGFPTNPNYGAEGSKFIFKSTVPFEMLKNIMGDQVF